MQQGTRVSEEAQWLTDPTGRQMLAAVGATPSTAVGLLSRSTLVMDELTALNCQLLLPVNRQSLWQQAST